MRKIPRPHWMTLAAVGLYIVALDQATKELVRSTLSPGEDLHLAGTFSIEPFRNPGIAGGGLAGNAVPMSVLATLAVAALLVFLARVGTLDRPVLVGFGLVIGGGVGNLVDRLRLGYVTDFILHGNNAFNLADVAILVGTLLILVGLVASLARPRLRAVRP
ncbi:MAG: signal peptidase II [Actinobacteria bacterium]|nr:MAG: signal peptidase II [Actinomycetota bacterium]